jgi:hypothetical protein
MRLKVLSALVAAGMVRAFVPQEAAAAPVMMVTPPMAMPGVEQVYYYHGHHYPYRYHGGYYSYRYNGAYYRNRVYQHGRYRYY